MQILPFRTDAPVAHCCRVALALAMLFPLSIEPALAGQSAPAQAAADAIGQTLAADTPQSTTQGNRFVAPAGWSIRTSGAAVILTAPETDSRVALVDVRDVSPDAAVEQAWTALRPGAAPPLQVATERPVSDGWEQVRFYTYDTPASAHRLLAARAFRRGALWTVVVGDISQEVAEKRGAQFGLLLSRLQPKEGGRESFAGKTAHALDASRIAAIGQFIRDAQQRLHIPGVAIGLVQDGRTVFQGGFGVRALGRPEAVDAQSLFMVASNTKALTTLMLAKLVDERRFDWETPVTQLLPGFRLGDAATTAQVRVKHLVCACTGLPRQDFEWLMEFQDSSAESALRTLAGMQPTSAFGALYQYSNPLAAAGGFVGGHVAYPRSELGTGYDRAMQSRVFEPLGMHATTFDFARALRANHAEPHAIGSDGRIAAVRMAINHSIVPVRPAGGAWSNVEDMLRYVRMELANGRLPDGSRYISEAALLARRAPQVASSGDAHYGMGLDVDRTWGIPVISHGGSMIGYKTDMLWLPEHGVGAVILTNADRGQSLLQPFQRRLMELLFDARPEAAAAVAASAAALDIAAAAERARWTLPAADAAVALLAPRYRNASLGELAIRRRGDATEFDFGEWYSEIGSRREVDGTLTFATLSPGGNFFEFIHAADAPDRLLLRDAQHEYWFDAVR
jgi:CubicO group peptidase (beta-lactamase class C family)